MLRTFEEHQIRPVQSLDGLWDFVVADERDDDAATLPERYPETIQVPSVWETIPGLENYRGQGWFRTHFEGPSGGRGLRLVFGGVSHTGTVYVDGEKVGRHYDAYTPWEIVLPDLDPGEHEMVVHVDNTFGDHSALHCESDYYTYGGISRPVELQTVPPLFVDTLRVTPQKEVDGWGLQVEVAVRNWSDEPRCGRLEVEVAGEVLGLGNIEVASKSKKTVHDTLTGLMVDSWDVDDPALYMVSTRLYDGAENLVDDKIDRVGFREVSVEGREVLLNGEPIQLRGFNRHEDHPQFGCALPLSAMMNDLNLIKHMGGNFIRTSHYPNDMRFLDLCDELGFYVWEEPHGKNFTFEEPMYEEQMLNSTREMLSWHHNHPSIIMWGFLNESESTTEKGREEHERLARVFRETDPSRPITFASNKGTDDVCLDLVDIVAWNRYDAWYFGGPEAVKPQLEKALKWLDSPGSNGGAGKPIIMSEFGAGAFYGCRKPSEPKWSENYQRRALDESLRVYLDHPAVVGTAIWQFCDVRATSGMWEGRPREMNNKGIVDEYRRPKAAYEVVKSRYEGEEA